MLRRLLFGLMALALIACSRPLNSLQSTVTISFPSGNGALSTQQLIHVSVSVSASDLSPTSDQWDGCNNCSNPPAVPSSFQLTVTSGTGRLFQVLAVYQDTTTQQLYFYYGDVTQDLNAGSSSANIQVPIATVSATNVFTGQVSGRYFDTPTSGPTGTVSVQYNPGGGKPGMEVGESMIVDGWFSAFMLSGTQLQYIVKETGEVLWGGPLDLTSSLMDPLASGTTTFTQRVRVFIPVHVQVNQNNGTTQYQPQQANTFVWGYWGPGASGKSVCTSGLDSSPVPQYLKQYVSTNFSSAPSFSVVHLASDSTAIPSATDMTNTTTPYTSIVVEGGDSATTAMCDSFATTPANLYSNYQSVSLSSFDGTGSNGSAGFQGFLRNSVSTSNNSNNFINISTTNGAVSLSGQVLPGVETVFSGVRLFKRIGNDNFQWNSPVCTPAALNSYGFIPASSSDASFDATDSFALASNISSTDIASGVNAVICPVANGIMQPNGVLVQHWAFSSNGGPSSMSPATQLAVLAPQGTMATGLIANHVCTPLIIEGLDASGNVGYFTNSITANLTSTDTSVGFYQDSACTSSLSNTMSFGGSQFMIFASRNSTGTGSSTITASATSYTSSANTISFMDTPGTITPKIRVGAANSMSAYGCNPISYSSWSDDGTTALIVNFATSNLATSFMANLPTGNLSYYTDPGCTTSYPSPYVNLGSATSYQPLYVKYTGTATSIDLQPTSLSPSTPMTIPGSIEGGLSISITQPGAASKLSMMTSNSLQQNMCTGVQIALTDSNGNPAPATAAMTLSLTDTLGGTFYASSSCSGAITSTTIAAGTSNSNIYFKSSVVGSDTLTATSTSPAMSATAPMALSHETFRNLLIAFPGQSVSGGSIIGTPSMIPQGIPVEITIYVTNIDGTIDTTYNGTLTNFSVTGAATSPPVSSPSSVQFNSGIAYTGFFPNASGIVTVTASAQGVYQMASDTTGPTTTTAVPTQFSMYMNNMAAVPYNGCQIFAVVAENSYGSFPLPTSTSYTLSSTGGTVYSDAQCTTAVTGTLTMTPPARIAAYFFKGTTPSASATITATPSGAPSYMSSTEMLLATSSTGPGTAAELSFTGRWGENVSVNSCEPFLISVSDSAGNTVPITTAQNISLSISGGGIGAPAFTDSGCSTGTPNTPTSIPVTSYVPAYITGMGVGATDSMSVTGTGLTSANTTVNSQ